LRKKKKTGICHLCGGYGELTFEHIPPRSAFNKTPVHVTEGIDVIGENGDLDEIKGIIYQGGYGKNTLCEKCNNNTGSWYGPAYADWVWQGLGYLLEDVNDPILYVPFRIFPLKVIKQILCMFFSTNGPRFGIVNGLLKLSHFRSFKLSHFLPI